MAGAIKYTPKVNMCSFIFENFHVSKPKNEWDKIKKACIDQIIDQSFKRIEIIIIEKRIQGHKFFQIFRIPKKRMLKNCFDVFFIKKRILSMNCFCGKSNTWHKFTN